MPNLTVRAPRAVEVVVVAAAPHPPDPVPLLGALGDRVAAITVVVAGLTDGDDHLDLLTSTHHLVAHLTRLTGHRPAYVESTVRVGAELGALFTHAAPTERIVVLSEHTPCRRQRSVTRAMGAEASHLAVAPPYLPSSPHEDS